MRWKDEKKSLEIFFGKNGWKICFSLRKKNGDFSFEFFDSVSTSIVVGTKDVYVIRGIVSQGSKLSKILRTTKTTTKKAVFFWKIRNKPHQNQKKNSFRLLINNKKISHLWKKILKKFPPFSATPMKKKSKCYKKNKNETKILSVYLLLF